MLPLLYEAMPNSHENIKENFPKEILVEEEHYVPGSLHFHYRKLCVACGKLDDLGEINYQFAGTEQPNKMQLKFCYVGNRYCTMDNCTSCHAQKYHECADSVDTCDSFSFHFSPLFLTQFTDKEADTFRNGLLSFGYKRSYNKHFCLDQRKRFLLDALKGTSYASITENVRFNAIVQELLLSSLQEVKKEENDQTFSCRFLANTTAKKKMYEAKNILLDNMGTSISIKELSKKLATNECYLKKGFKEVFGITIHDFYQQQKMEHAKFLLYEKGMTVTDVSAKLGFASISHFSYAFKKQTGLKACELLR